MDAGLPMARACADCAQARHKPGDHRRHRGWASTDRMNEDQEICYDFTIELQRSKRVSDATYARALKRFGETGVLDIAGISGYYTNLAMTLNTARFPIPAGGQRLPRFPE